MVDPDPARPGIKQFNHEGCLSYVLFDRASGQAVVLDPRADTMDEYRPFIAENRLKITFAIDTHTHADHYSGTHFFAREYGAVIAMSGRTPSHRVGRKLAHGESISVGALTLRALETPGHTADSMSFFGCGMVFTGDTLFISSSGRTDFPTADAGEQWRSIHEVLGALPEGTLVFPAHDYETMICSTIGVEKKRNLHWLLPTKEAFIMMKRAEEIPTAQEEIRKRVEFNLSECPAGMPANTAGATACGGAVIGNVGVASINVQKLAAKIEERMDGCAFIDVREPGEFQEGHFPGAENIPLSEIGLHFERLMKLRRVYFSCLSGARSLSAAKTVSYWGVPDAVNVSGGYRAWTKAGFSVEK